MIKEERFTMAFAREYVQQQTFSLQMARDAQIAQYEIYKSGFEKPDKYRLTNVLSAITTVAGIFLKEARLANTVVSLVNGLAVDEEKILETMVKNGSFELTEVVGFLQNNTRYDLVECDVPFIEYETAGVRFVTGKCRVKRVHVKGGGWIIM
jgi:hypothetical protein